MGTEPFLNQNRWLNTDLTTGGWSQCIYFKNTMCQAEAGVHNEILMLKTLHAKFCI